MSQIIERYINECKDSTLTQGHRNQLLDAIKPIPTTENFYLPEDDRSMPTVPVMQVDKERIQRLLLDFRKDGANEETLTWIEVLIKTEIYGEFKLSNDIEVI